MTPRSKVQPEPVLQRGLVGRFRVAIMDSMDHGS